jgi:hypothetical protein
MLRLPPLALAAALLVSPALGQSLTGSGVEGNWGCRANIDGTRAGLLTIYAGSYGYASANYGSIASGSGAAQIAGDGVTFVDGNLPGKVGIVNGVLSFDDQGRDVLILNTPDKPVLTCTPR